jgi:hypothetical protein
MLSTAFAEVLAMRENESLETFSMAGSNARIGIPLHVFAAFLPKYNTEEPHLSPRTRLLPCCEDESKELITVTQEPTTDWKKFPDSALTTQEGTFGQALQTPPWRVPSALHLAAVPGRASLSWPGRIFRLRKVWMC